MTDEAQETRPKHAGGRPSKYRSEMIEQARKLATLGATDREMADFFEVSESTFYLWKLEHPELSEALKQSKEAADERVEHSLYRRALGYSHDAVKIVQVGGEVVNAPYVEHYPPDTTAAIFWLKNRRPKEWRDRQELTGADGKDLIPEALSEVEVARRIAFALQQGANAQEQK